MKIETTRRGFLKGAAATSAAALVIGVTPSGLLAKSGDATFNPFVKITPDGAVTAVIKHFEMGQGTTTGLASLIAEELGVPVKDVGYEYAPSDNKRYANLFFHVQATGGSTAMANSFMQYRQAGAAAREMLINAAAAEWKVPAGDLKIEDGVISGAGKKAGIGKFVAAAVERKVPAKPRLKKPSEFKVIGDPKTTRSDTPEKINGTAKFAMDTQLDGQIVVAIKRIPRLGAKVASFDAKDAKDVPGFITAKMLPNKAGVAVYAKNTWAAFQARNAVEVTWDNSKAEKRSSEDIRKELLSMVNKDSQFVATPGQDLAAVNAALAKADKVVEAEFYVPMLAHSPMEPLSCTIEPTKDGIILHDGCQLPGVAHPTLAAILKLKPEQVQINTVLAGGSFGRRGNPAADYQVEAALAFVMTDRKAPVKLVWSREDDVTGGYYRPAFAHKVRAGLDAKGKIVAWDHRIAGQSIFKGTPFERAVVKNGIDHASVEGVANTLYKIPQMHVGLSDAKPAAKVLWWRAVGHTHTAWVMESMMDMLATAAKKDPVAFRLDYLRGGNASQKRLANVLRLAAEKSGWGKKPPAGRSRGIAVHHSFRSYVAEVAEISTDAKGAVKIEKVTCAVDCGIAVNPDIIKAQMEGGIGYGLGHVMRNEVTLADGAVEQSNFPDYEPLRIGDIGAIDVHIVKSTLPPTGVGEPGLPPAGPALANAIAVSGKRVKSLPMVKNGVTFG